MLREPSTETIREQTSHYFDNRFLLWTHHAVRYRTKTVVNRIRDVLFHVKRGIL